MPRRDMRQLQCGRDAARDRDVLISRLAGRCRLGQRILQAGGKKTAVIAAGQIQRYKLSLKCDAHVTQISVEIKVLWRSVKIGKRLARPMKIAGGRNTRNIIAGEEADAAV